MSVGPRPSFTVKFHGVPSDEAPECPTTISFDCDRIEHVEFGVSLLRDVVCSGRIEIREVACVRTFGWYEVIR